VSTIVKVRQIREAWVGWRSLTEADREAWRVWFLQYGVDCGRLVVEDGQPVVTVDDFAHTISFRVVRTDARGELFIDPEDGDQLAKRIVVITVDDEIPTFPQS